MTTYRYPGRAMVGDYLRSAAGLALTAGPLTTMPASSGVAAVLGGFAALFGVFGLRTLIRHQTTVHLDDHGITVSGIQRRQVAWRELAKVRLNYYSTKRDRAGGWMQLTVQGSGWPIRFDSTLDGFADVAHRSHQAARDNGVALSEVTIANLQALGVTPTKRP
ncbi:MAG: hypothetical protein HYR63_06825 [Proteobacteria bacterium]|nr:hypothetical protein [Pseudomonadota bacterium]